MNVEGTCMKADPQNLPKVDTWMLFDFLKNGRKFSYTEFELKNDKENVAIDKYGDNSISLVSILRNPIYCVVKARILVDNGNSCYAVRALIHEIKNVIHKIECKKCTPIECVHGFALLMWLHRRTEEMVENIVSYYKKPSLTSDKITKQDTNRDCPPTLLSLSPTSTSSSTMTTNYLNNNNYSPDTKLFLHKSGILTQRSTNSSQHLQTLYHITQHISKNTLQKSNSNSKHSQMINSGTGIHEYCETESSNSVSVQSLPRKVIPLSQTANTEHAISPKQHKTVRKVPYLPKPAKVNSSKTLKEQPLLSKKVSQLIKQPKIEHFFIRPKAEIEDSKPQIQHLFMSKLVKDFLKLNNGTVEDFIRFAEKQMSEFLCKEAEKLTRVQRTDLWMELRYGRITASIIHEAACCRTMNGSLVNKILGKVSEYQTPAMKRGIDLEDKILQEVQKQNNITINSSGLFLIPWCPIVGASPDAIGSDFIVEVKAPSTYNTFKVFLPNGDISKKYKRQMYLQMYCTGMKKGVFCVADPQFEINKKVTTVWLDYDEKFTEILERAKIFWITAIFPRLVNM